MDVPVGRITYPQWLNARDGIEADLTVTRTGEETFVIVTGTGSIRRDLDWLRRHIPNGAHVAVTDVTSQYAVLSIMGPAARDLLSSVTDADVSNEAFPFGTSRTIDVGYADARAARITYVGELGWELYIPADTAVHVYDTIIGATGAERLAHCGYHALDSLRIEKGYRHWGHDITDQDTSLEAGLSFTHAWDKSSGFIGRDALLRQREAGIDQRLVTFVLEDPEPLLYHLEPIIRDGVNVGHIRSGSYGHAIGAAIGLGYVRHPEGGPATLDLVRTGDYEIEVAGERYAARAMTRAPYDPDGERIRA
jgi:4-methylaminobutanoate oxidase (formaldehyde-forming)